MPQLTLLDIVQKTLSATNGFEVDSIDDTPEAGDIAGFAEDVYNDFIAELPEWQFQEKLLSLESSLDNTKPNYMRIPTGVTKIKYSTVEYNNGTLEEPDYRVVKYLHPDEFLNALRHRNTSNTIAVQDYDGVVCGGIATDKHPEYYSTFDGEHLIFDSYDSSVDTTLQETKTRFIGTKERVFNRVDDFIIPLPNHLQSYYLAMVRAKASEYLNGEPLVSDIRKGQAGLVKARIKHKKVGGLEHNTRRKNYGR